MDGKSSDWRPGPTVCRCCLSEGCYKDISTEYFWMGKREVYAEMLSETLNVSISYSQSSGPNSNSRLICEPCISRLRDASDFRKQVIECEKTFIQHLDPGHSSNAEVEIHIEPQGREVKVEQVKVERKFSDDEFDNMDYGDDEDDDLDDQPLTKFASKVPKKESVDLLDLLDNSQITVKRKSSSKSKTTPTKKMKVTKKEIAKPSPSKAPAKIVEKKKKENQNDPNANARRNAELILKHATVYPFRLPARYICCVYCGEEYQEAEVFRRHMDDEHELINVQLAFAHHFDGYIKADCTHIRCRICDTSFDTVHEVATHLLGQHNMPVDTSTDMGITPFKLEKDKFECAMCNKKVAALRQLNRHTITHFVKHTCETCGKTFASHTSLTKHVRFLHAEAGVLCRSCLARFNTVEEKRKHIHDSRRCWAHVCSVCGDRFKTWNLKQDHLRTAHGSQDGEHVCQECGNVFDCRRKYQTHFKIRHSDDNFACSCCGLKFDTKRKMEEHRVTHTKEKPFPCTLCSKTFARKRNLAQHMWGHSDHKRFECKPCEKRYIHRVTWKKHVMENHPDLVKLGVLEKA